MSISGAAPLDVFASLPNTQGTAGTTGGLTQNDFLQLLVAELQNQNPLDPVSTSSYVQEMATLSEVSAVEQMTQALSSLFALTSASAATGLIGRTVTVSPSGGANVTGTVTAVTASPSGPLLTVNGATYALSDVTQVASGQTGGGAP